MPSRTFLALASLALVGGAAQAQGRPEPKAEALRMAAYIYAATNVCGFRMAPDRFERLIGSRGATLEEVGIRGPYGNQIRTMFALISNGMAQNRPLACEAAWREFGREGTIDQGLFQEAPPPDGTTARP